MRAVQVRSWHQERHKVVDAFNELKWASSETGWRGKCDIRREFGSLEPYVWVSYSQGTYKVIGTEKSKGNLSDYFLNSLSHMKILMVREFFIFTYKAFQLYFFIFTFFTLQYCMVLPYTDMNQSWVYMCSPSWTPLPPPSPSHPSGSSQCTSPKHLVSCIEPGLVIHFTYDNLHVSMPFSHIIPPSPSPTESKRLLNTSVSLLLSRIQGYHYHLSKFHIYMLVYCIGVFLSGLLHSV